MSLDFQIFPQVSTQNLLDVSSGTTAHLSVDALGQAWQAGHVFELLISGLHREIESADRLELRICDVHVVCMIYGYICDICIIDHYRII